MGKWCLHASLFVGNKDMFFEMKFDLGTLDSGEQSLPFGLLVFANQEKISAQSIPEYSCTGMRGYRLKVMNKGT